jgi:hypothetical protein
MVTAEQAKNMRSGINIEGTVERKGKIRETRNYILNIFRF